MKKRYIIYCEMDYDYLKNVSVAEILSDGTESPRQSLPVKEDSYTRNDYVLEIDIPEKASEENKELLDSKTYKKVCEDMAKGMDAFILEELKPYMEYGSESEGVVQSIWTQPVRIRLKELKDNDEFHRQNFRNSFEHFMELLKDNNGLGEWITRHNESWNSISDLFAEAFKSFGCYIDDKGDCKIKKEVE